MLLLDTGRPPTCLECFTNSLLTEDQIAIIEREIILVPPVADLTVQALCEYWEANPGEIPGDLSEIEQILSSPPPPPQVANEFIIRQLIDCLERVLGVQATAEPLEGQSVSGLSPTIGITQHPFPLFYPRGI